jgi:multiple sugar transport system substrate-binding protein
LLSIIAVLLEPKTANNGKIPLVWVSDDSPVRQQQIKLFNELYPKDWLTLDPNDNGPQKVIVQSIAGVGPDLFDSAGPSELDTYVKSGVAWDITDELKQRGIDVTKSQWPVSHTYIISHGRVYGCMTNVAAAALWVNEDMFAKAGVPIPKGDMTWDQFIPIAQKLIIKDKAGNVVQWPLVIDWSVYWTQFLQQWGGAEYSPDGTRCVLDSPQAIAGIQFLHDLVYKYKIVPSTADTDAMATTGGWGSGTISLFENQRNAMSMGGRWWLVTLRNNTPFKMTAITSPHASGGPLINYANGRATIINQNSPHREAALDFLTYLNSQAYNEQVNDAADGLGPVPKYAFTKTFLHDPKHPDETDNTIWREAQERGVAVAISPYINSADAQDIINEQIQLIEADQKPVPQAMRDAAANVNAEIAKNLSEDPNLKRQYLQVTGGRMP